MKKDKMTTKATLEPDREIISVEVKTLTREVNGFSVQNSINIIIQALLKSRNEIEKGIFFQKKNE
jgi:hypothetical protein